MQGDSILQIAICVNGLMSHTYPSNMGMKLITSTKRSSAFYTKQVLVSFPYINGWRENLFYRNTALIARTIIKWLDHRFRLPKQYSYYFCDL